jgi:hypothetical protein
MPNLILNQMNNERAQLKQRNNGRPQLKSNDPWQSSISLKILANIKLNQMVHGRVQLAQKNSRIQIKSNDLWKSSIKLKETIVVFK